MSNWDYSTTFSFDGYEIPVHLLNMTGGGSDTFEQISNSHMFQLKKYIDLKPTDSVFELGCGIGRDALPLTKILDKESKYCGLDIILGSIEWCRNNISKRHPNFTFLHKDIKDQLHNSNGTIKTTDIKIDLEDKSVDKVIAWSVFTHMYANDIKHYLKEFHRIVKDDGELYLTCFVFTDEVLKKARETNLTIFNLRFEHSIDDNTRINDRNHPLGAIAYKGEYLSDIVRECGFKFKYGDILNGGWSGYYSNPHDAQDVLVLQKI